MKIDYYTAVVAKESFSEEFNSSSVGLGGFSQPFSVNSFSAFLISSSLNFEYFQSRMYCITSSSKPAWPLDTKEAHANITDANNSISFNEYCFRKSTARLILSLAFSISKFNLLFNLLISLNHLSSSSITRSDLAKVGDLSLI